MLLLSLLRKIIQKKRIKAKIRRRRRRRVRFIFGVLFILLAPLALTVDIKKREWNIASLLLRIQRRPSEEQEGKRETNVTIPGALFVADCWRNTIDKLHLIKEEKCHDCECEFDEDIDGEDQIEADINE